MNRGHERNTLFVGQRRREAKLEQRVKRRRRDLRLIRRGGKIFGFVRLPIDKRQPPEQIADQAVVRLAVDERGEIGKVHRADAVIGKILLYAVLLGEHEAA